MTDYKQLCAELVEQLDDALDFTVSSETRRHMKLLTRKARAALVEPEPEGLTLAEVDDLCAEHSFLYEDDESLECLLLIITDALARWGSPALQPVPLSERLPEPSTKVLAHYFNDLGKGRTICAIWVPAKSRSDEGDLDRDDFLEYDEEGDKYYWPEGWYEAIENWEELGWVKVDEGEVVYWQPLPKWPAMPLPVGEVE